MLRTTVCITAVILAIGASAPAFAGQPLSQAEFSGATEFSSRSKGGAAKPSGGPKVTTRTVTTKRVTTPSGGGPKLKSKTVTNKTVTTTKKVNVNTNANINTNPKFKGKPNLKPGTPAVQTAIGRQGATALKASTVKFQSGPGPINKAAFKPAPNLQFVKLGNNKSAMMWNSGPKKIWWGNKWKWFVPVSALGVVVLGGAYYYPYSYLAVSRPYCEGITPDGCRLNWQRVDFEDGDSEWQCVQFCRRPGNPPPPRTVALVAPPPVPQGGACQISIYSEPNFGGVNATASEEQPRLAENGWQNQVASVKVAAGTWDFFTDPEFTGETMRLAPGDYPTLAPEWSRKAGSFMCVQP
ncbi:MAG: beta/gamma crystallin family protein [Xanthobacteraceae bacterium]|nr:beta/gamma crystallin family protein [Xanthobacteraceae bacterium]